MPVSCYWEKSLLLDGRKVNRNRKNFHCSRTPVAPFFGVSWLKIEPRSQFFLVIKATNSVAFITATMKIFLFLSTYKFFKFIPYQFYQENLFIFGRAIEYNSRAVSRTHFLILNDKIVAFYIIAIDKKLQDLRIGSIMIK